MNSMEENQHEMWMFEPTPHQSTIPTLIQHLFQLFTPMCMELI